MVVFGCLVWCFVLIYLLMVVMHFDDLFNSMIKIKNIILCYYYSVLCLWACIVVLECWLWYWFVFDFACYFSWLLGWFFGFGLVIV